MPIRRVCLKHKWPTLFRRAFSASRSELSDRIYTYFTHVTHPQHACHDKKQYFLSESFCENEKFSLLIIGRRLFRVENCWNTIVPECWSIERHFSIASLKVLPPNPTVPSLQEREIYLRTIVGAKSVRYIAQFEGLASHRQQRIQGYRSKSALPP